MQSFQLPSYSIPTNKIKIPEAQLSKFMDKNHFKPESNNPKFKIQMAQQFSSLFSNVNYDSNQSNQSTSQSTQPQTQIKIKQNNKHRYLIPYHKGHLYDQVNEQKQQQKVRLHSQEVAKRKKFIKPPALSRTLQSAHKTDQTLNFISNALITNEDPQNMVKQQYKLIDLLNDSQLFDESTMQYDDQEDIQIIGKVIPGNTNFNIKRYLAQKNQENYKNKPQREKIDITKHQSKVAKELQKFNIPESPLVKEDKSLQSESNKDNSRLNFMFMKDDRDRFGNQLFPIANWQISPGPGDYETNNQSLEERTNKILIKKNQQEVIRQWKYKQITLETKQEQSTLL